MNIRKFSGCDIEQILYLQDEWFDSDILPAYVNRIFEDDFTEDNTIVVEDNNIIGYSFFEINKFNEYEIMFLYLSKAERNKEIGRALINSVETEIKARGGKKIILSPTTLTDEDNLIRYYTKLGYTHEEDKIVGRNLHIIMSKTV